MHFTFETEIDDNIYLVEAYGIQGYPGDYNNAPEPHEVNLVAVYINDDTECSKNNLSTERYDYLNDEAYEIFSEEY